MQPVTKLILENGFRFGPPQICTATVPGEQFSPKAPPLRGGFRASTAAGIRLPASAGSRPCRRRRQHRHLAGSSCSLLTRHTLPHLSRSIHKADGCGAVSSQAAGGAVRCRGKQRRTYGLVGARRFVFVTGGPFKVVTPHEATGSGPKRPFHDGKRGGPG